MVSKKSLIQTTGRECRTLYIVPAVSLLLLSLFFALFLHSEHFQEISSARIFTSAANDKQLPLQAENHDDQSSYLSIRQLFAYPANQNNRSSILNHICGEQQQYNQWLSAAEIYRQWDSQNQTPDVFLQEVYCNSVSERAGPPAA